MYKRRTKNGISISRKGYRRWEEHFNGKKLGRLKPRETILKLERAALRKKRKLRKLRRIQPINTHSFLKLRRKMADDTSLFMFLLVDGADIKRDLRSPCFANRKQLCQSWYNMTLWVQGLIRPEISGKTQPIFVFSSKNNAVEYLWVSIRCLRWILFYF